MGISSRRKIVGDGKQVFTQKRSNTAGKTERVCDVTICVRSDRLACTKSLWFPLARMTVAQHEVSNDLVTRGEQGAPCRAHWVQIFGAPFDIGQEAMTTGIPKVKSEKTPTISSAVDRYVLEYFITCSSMLQATRSKTIFMPEREYAFSREITNPSLTDSDS